MVKVLVLYSNSAHSSILASLTTTLDFFDEFPNFPFPSALCPPPINIPYLPTLRRPRRHLPVHHLMPPDDNNNNCNGFSIPTDMIIVATLLLILLMWIKYALEIATNRKMASIGIKVSRTQQRENTHLGGFPKLIAFQFLGPTSSHHSQQHTIHPYSMCVSENWPLHCCWLAVACIILDKTKSLLVYRPLKYNQ